jgi:ABC-type enterobactin transport system permease subunit
VGTGVGVGVGGVRVTAIGAGIGSFLQALKITMLQKISIKSRENVLFISSKSVSYAFKCKVKN